MEAPTEERKAAEPAVMPPPAEEAKPSAEAPAEKAKTVEPEAVPPPVEEKWNQTGAPFLKMVRHRWVSQGTCNVSVADDFDSLNP